MSAETVEAQRVLAGVAYPAGVTAQIDGGHIALVIPRDGGLMTPKVKRLGGWWDGPSSRFLLPLTAATALPRILKNWEREYAAATAQREAQAADRERERLEQQRRREAEWARERQTRETARREDETRRAQARANRVKVVAGQYAVGDVLDGQRITGFGQMWTEGEMVVPDKYWHGELYEPCPICGREPVELEAGVCERHHPHAVQVRTEYCYAYRD
jgi:hypothetical protein